MKTINTVKEEIIKKEETVFEADDGTRFNDKEECKKYEDTALAVLRSRCASFVQRVNNVSYKFRAPDATIKNNSWRPADHINHLMSECEDDCVWIARPKSSEDAENLQRLCTLQDIYNRDDSFKANETYIICCYDCRYEDPWFNGNSCLSSLSKIKEDCRKAIEEIENYNELLADALKKQAEGEQLR